MQYLTRTGKPLPKVVADQAKKVGNDPVNRREFLALASTFGATAATAYGMLGQAAPAREPDIAASPVSPGLSPVVPAPAPGRDRRTVCSLLAEEGGVGAFPFLVEAPPPRTGTRRRAERQRK